MGGGGGEQGRGRSGCLDLALGMEVPIGIQGLQKVRNTLQSRAGERDCRKMPRFRLWLQKGSKSPACFNLVRSEMGEPKLNTHMSGSPRER